MKKVISVFLCMVMMFTFIPTLFASASPVEAAVVAAADGAEGDSSSSSGLDLGWLKDFATLFTGIWEAIGGETILLTIKTILSNFLEIVSFGEFFDSIKAIWNDVK